MRGGVGASQHRLRAGDYNVRMTKTSADWVKEALASSSPEEQRRCLREAEARVRYLSDLPRIAALFARLGDLADAHRCLDRALEQAKSEIWVYRHAAEVYLGDLSDPDGARLALARCAAAFTARAETRSYEWVLLAEGYKRLLADDAGAAVCLERGLDAARQSDDFCSMAEGYVKHAGDLARAHELLLHAESLLRTTADGYGFWGVANVYHGPLGDPESARRTLERGLLQATSVGACINLAQACVHHDPGPGMQRCLDKAGSLARTARDWLELGEAIQELRRDAARIRSCLEMALAAGPDRELRQGIARGFRHWLRDAEAADRVSQRGTAPEALLARRRTLVGWTAEPSGLLGWLRARLSEKDLCEIAGADYGNSFSEHLAALTDIYETGLVPHPLSWYPAEVLTLTRWGEGALVNHRARAFACALLCLDESGPESHRDDCEASLPPLIESCIALGPEALAALTGFLVALIEGRASEEGSGLAFLYLALVLTTAARDLGDPRLAPLAEQALELARGYCAEHAPLVEDYLLGMTCYTSGLSLWRALAAELLRESPDAPLLRLAERLRPQPVTEADLVR